MKRQRVQLPQLQLQRCASRPRLLATNGPLERLGNCPEPYPILQEQRRSVRQPTTHGAHTHTTRPATRDPGPPRDERATQRRRGVLFVTAPYVHPCLNTGGTGRRRHEVPSEAESRRRGTGRGPVHDGFDRDGGVVDAHPFVVGLLVLLLANGAVAFGEDTFNVREQADWDARQRGPLASRGHARLGGDPARARKHTAGRARGVGARGSGGKGGGGGCRCGRSRVRHPHHLFHRLHDVPRLANVGALSFRRGRRAERAVDAYSKRLRRREEANADCVIQEAVPAVPRAFHA